MNAPENGFKDLEINVGYTNGIPILDTMTKEYQESAKEYFNTLGEMIEDYILNYQINTNY